ncbi:TetR/AcrR family transcriptional regulator [Pseudomonas sp. NPDC087342]|uniref:TetR/AcrR family transcriptional regulator n=1 Tax=Pseudomonas TaxID=286 RepID=UPI0025B1C2AA|nr:TetR/AcrR family transcriptional regulator [Pseudomonas nunensis]MDN3224285.1 TetR/AcrR family transcriptional regulator [Pseudomonas nunensis]
MKISKEKAEANRATLIETASRLFRQKGIDGVGVAEISKSAGLTHGALYAHFPSKEALAAEALAWSLEQSNAKLYSGTVDGEPDLERFLCDYLSVDKRDDYADHCAMAASASEIGRQDTATSSKFTEGYLVLVRAFERRVAANNPAVDALATAMGIVAAMIGALSVARATAKARPEVSAQVLQGVRPMIDAALGKPYGEPEKSR